MLVVIAIIATLREKTRQIACLSNTKQLGLAFVQHTQDYDEQMPYCCPDDTATPA